ncbi:MAG TPA: hypothetical protein VHX16_13245 [Chloroflexota bacterium]|jgi:hypothetical protein|nr:hypothetical protein [Chloroflexota bacterium]
MKSLTVRLAEAVVAEIEAESRGRRCSKSDIVGERLQPGSGPTPTGVNQIGTIADLVGSVDELPADLSARTEHYLNITGIAPAH